MKKVLKVLTVFVMLLALTGCMKIRYQINITDENKADVNLTMLYSKEMMDTYNMTQESIKEQLMEDDTYADWDLKDASEKVDGEEYVGFKAAAPKNVSKEILNSLTVKGDKYTLKLKGSDVSGSFDTSQFDQLGYSMDQLEKMGLEVSIKIAMPGKVKSSTVGKIENGVVTLGLADLEKLTTDITIVSEKSGSSSNIGLIVGGIAVVAIVAGGGFYFYKKKNKASEDEE
ncbi:MAG: LppM family (lipo)protein [Thomasclavelia sp.]|uniref:LppM family (lipo)protein n=1 Tax=Thomasclavelia sp. TaxID=3025757 RepID=UPI0039A166C4